MSRISDHISVSDSFTVLPDDSLKENQSLREQLRQRDVENAFKFEELSNTADSLCKLVAENNSGSKETKSKKGNSKVHVPTSCAKPMRHFVSLCKNIYIYKICIFQLLSRVYKPLATLLWKLQNQVKELWQLKQISMYKTRVVSLCKNIYIYKICIFQLLSRVYKPLATLLWKLQNQVKELWQLKQISMYKTRVVIHVSVLERHIRHRFTGA